MQHIPSTSAVVQPSHSHLLPPSNPPHAQPLPPHHDNKKHLLLLADTDSATPSASSLCVLTTDTETPVVTETSVCADLLEALKVVTELGVDTVGEDLAVLTLDNIALPVEEP
jgi:hypothetical protein